MAFNAGASLYVAGVADSLANGVERALDAMVSGAATRKLEAFVERTRAWL